MEIINTKFYNETNELPDTTPTLSWVTWPHLYLGVDTLDFTLTLSPTLMAAGPGRDGGKPSNSTWMNRTQ